MRRGHHWTAFGPTDPHTFAKLNPFAVSVGGRDECLTGRDRRNPGSVGLDPLLVRTILGPGGWGGGGGVGPGKRVRGWGVPAQRIHREVAVDASALCTHASIPVSASWDPRSRRPQWHYPGGAWRVQKRCGGDTPLSGAPPKDVRRKQSHSASVVHGTPTRDGGNCRGW